MSDRHDRHEASAVFWCTLLSPLLFGDIPPDEAGEFLRRLADTEQLFPDGTRKKPSRTTLCENGNNIGMADSRPCFVSLAATGANLARHRRR